VSLPNSPEPRPPFWAVTARLLVERFRGPLLCGMIIFSPWAFGTTQRWSITLMNVAAIALGVMLVVNRLASRAAKEESRRFAWPVVVLASATFFLLGYSLVSAVNSAATYLPSELRLESRPHIRWLPHSFDGPSSWKISGRCLV
jgi:hypothetical protein